jgi:hypothetical protein
MNRLLRGFLVFKNYLLETKNEEEILNFREPDQLRRSVRAFFGNGFVY